MRSTVPLTAGGIPRILAIVFLAAWSGSLYTASAHVAIVQWDPSPDAAVVGYRIYYGVKPGCHTQMLDIGSALSVRLEGMAVGQTTYCVITAYNSAGLESLPSEEIAVSTPANGDWGIQAIRIEGDVGWILVDGAPGTTQRVEVSTDLSVWTPLATVEFDGNGIEVRDAAAGAARQRFYRVIGDTQSPAPGETPQG